MIPPKSKEEGLAVLRGLIEKVAEERLLEEGGDAARYEMYAYRLALIWIQRWADEEWVREFATLALRKEDE